jgi:uncharacterized protein (TIGR02246 family)
MPNLTSNELHTLVAHLAVAWQHPDIEAGCAPFAEDAVLITPERRYAGRAAIVAAMRAFWQGVSAVRIELRRSVADEALQSVAVEWRWSETDRATGRITAYDDAIVGQLHDGKIVYWREYITPAHPDEENAKCKM